MRLHRAAFGFALAVSASPALAEVSDKIPSLAALWGWATGFTLAALMLALWRPASGLLVLPLAALWAWGGLDMVTDAQLGPAILREQGAAYVRAVHWSGAAGVIGPLLAVLGVALWRSHGGTPVDSPRRHDHRLSAREPAFFIAALEAALARPPEIITPGDPHAGRYGKRRTFLWDLFGAGEGGFDFHLVVFSETGAPEDAHPLARAVFAQLIAMDDAARAIPGDGDANDYLFSITLDLGSGMVQLDYASIAVNTEWSVHFRPEADGTFTCLGIPDWRAPGRYIV